jgi:hypothetical protein
VHINKDIHQSIRLKDLKKRIASLQTDIRYLECKCLRLCEQLSAVSETLSQMEDILDAELGLKNPPLDV